MRFFSLVLITICLFTDVFSDDNQKPKNTLILQPGSDPFFGYYINSTYNIYLTKKLNTILYGNIFVIPNKPLRLNVSQFWCEGGTGLSYQFNPQWNATWLVGFVDGTYIDKKEPFVDAFENGLSYLYNGNKIYSNGGLMYYKAFRNSGVFPNDILWYWVFGMYKINSKVYAGLNFEYLFEPKKSNYQGKLMYEWIGPMIQYNFNNSYFFRFTAGPDLAATWYYKTGLYCTF